MQKFIRRLREKPEHVRKRIAFFSTISIFSLVVFVWWSSWGIPYGVSEDNVSIKEVLSPVEIASDFIISAGSEIVSLKNQLKANSQEIASGTPEDNIATVIKGIEDVEKIRKINNIVYPDEIFAPGTSSLPQKQN